MASVGGEVNLKPNVKEFSQNQLNHFKEVSVSNYDENFKNVY